MSELLAHYVGGARIGGGEPAESLNPSDLTDVVATAPQAALARFAPFVRDYFGIGHDRKVVYGVSFGYADEQHPANSYRTGRAALSETVRFHS